MLDEKNIIKREFIINSLKKLILEETGKEKVFSGIKINSKEIKKGNIFLALKGEKEDGHSYINEAIKNGATGIITEKALNEEQLSIFYVQDSILALQEIAKNWKEQYKNIVTIGITGSVGKTTTKQFTEKILSSEYNTIAPIKNFNNEIGLPLTMLKINNKTEILILEMGMYQRGDIAQLAEIAQPDHGIITNIEAVHLERAGSIKNIFLAKKELIDALPANGLAILNNDDEKLRKMINTEKRKIISFGVNKKSDIHAKNIIDNGLKGFKFDLFIKNQFTGTLKIKQPGIHLLPSLLASIAIGNYFQVSPKKIKLSLEKFLLEDRLQVINKKNNITIIDDTYNSSPSSVIGALKLLDKATNYKIAILGDMRELGKMTKQNHKNIGEIAAQNADEIICLGRDAKDIYIGSKKNTTKKVFHFENTEQLLNYVNKQKFNNATILVKGSRALKMEDIVRQIK
ncbi:MAG: hypothetical protein CL710_02085 [Chloroflexi bacterium]|nr:hypothetical protein [Chloroflexota bacterium]|tara:strand:- start:24709 stop:26082 length:1374 start_codon:yes stop_codon:yes gene_type:complete